MLKIRWPNLPLTRWPVLDRSLSYHGFQGASALKLWGVPFNSWWYFVYLKFQEPPPKIIQDSLTYPGSKINPQFFRLLKGKVISPRWMSTFCAKMKWLFHQLLWVFSYQIKPLYTYQEPFKLEKDNIQPGTTWRTKKSIHPWRLTWNMIMEVWKIIFLSKWMICRFHVNLPECKHQFSSKSSLHKIADVETPLSSDPWSSWRFGVPKVRWFPSPLLPLIFRVKKEFFRGVARHLGFFVWGVETEIDVLFMDKTKESKQINLFFEVGDLGHVQVEKKPHYINEPPPLNKPKTPPLNKEKPHSLILSIVRRPPLFHFWVSRAGRMAERGLGGGNQGWSFDSKILPKMDDLVVILWWFTLI